MSDTEDDSCSSENWLVNAEWIQDFLRDYHKQNGEFVIKDYNVTAGSSNGVSNLSEVLAVKIDYEYKNECKHLDLFIKLLPHDPFSRYFVTEAQFDLREIKFYTQILPDLLDFQKRNLNANTEPMLIPVPKCYHTTYSLGSFIDHQHLDASPEPPESILVLEDMRPLGYKSAHFTKGLTLEEAKCAIVSISSVHALSLGLKLKEKIDLNDKYPFLFQITKASDSYQQLVEQGLPHLTKFLQEKGGKDNEITALNEMRPKTRDIIETLLQPIEPMGLITHTDFWCNNLLLKEPVSKSRKDNCVILDWQMVTYSRPTNDIALLLISSLHSKIRRENMAKLLEFYYQCLTGNLAKININLEKDLGYTLEKLENDYRKSQLLALLLCIGSVDIALGNEQAEQRFLDVLEDFHKEGILSSDFLNDN